MSSPVTVAFAGDLLVTRSLAGFREAGLLDDLAKWTLKADAAAANLETVVHDYQFPPAATSGGTWLRAPAEVIGELAELGVAGLSLANNHTGDYGPEGMFNTVAAARAAGVATAGAGADLSAAAAVAPIAVKQLRLGLVAAATTASLESAATDPADGVRARPGVFRIATANRVMLPSDHFMQLTELSAAFGNVASGDTLRHAGLLYVRSDGHRLESAPHPADLDRFAEAVAAGVRSCDVVAVSLHSHEGSGRMDRPSDALVTLARVAVEAGAAIVACHGPHLVRGIEVQGNAVVFYSLGSLFFQARGVDRQPPAMRRDVGLPGDAPLADVWSRSIDYLASPRARESIVPICTWHDGRLTEVRIAAFITDHRDGDTYGLPRGATPIESALVAERINDLSARWGTKVRVDDDGTLVLNLTRSIA